MCLRAYSCSMCTQYYRWNVLRFVHDIFLCLWLVNCLLNTNRTPVINMYLHDAYNVKCSIVNCYYIIQLHWHSASAVHLLRAWARRIGRNHIATYTAKGFDVTIRRRRLNIILIEITVEPAGTEIFTLLESTSTKWKN